jgi:hypothetical protein
MFIPFKTMQKLLVEAVSVGLSLAAVVWLIRRKDFLFMFLVGFGIHLGFELVGLNKWYCRNGVACRSN